MAMKARPSIGSALLASGCATLPYLAINLGQIALHDGGYIHFSKVEAAAITVVFATILWMQAALLLVFAAWLSGGGRWRYACLAIGASALLATVVQPQSWFYFFDWLNAGVAEWIFRVGFLATMLTILAPQRFLPFRP